MRSFDSPTWQLISAAVDPLILLQKLPTKQQSQQPIPPIICSRPPSEKSSKLATPPPNQLVLALIYTLSAHSLPDAQFRGFYKQNNSQKDMQFATYLLLLALLTTPRLCIFTSLYKITPPDAEAIAAFPLGHLPASTTLQISLKFFKLTPVNRLIAIAIYSDQLTPLNSLTTPCPITSNSCQEEIVVPDANSYLIKPVSLTGYFSEPFYLAVNSLENGRPKSLLRVVETRFGTSFVKYFNVNSPSDYTVTLSGLLANPVSSLIGILKYNLTHPLTATTSPNIASYPRYNNYAQTNRYRLDKGLYMLFMLDRSIPSKFVVLGWDSDPYPCPFEPSYVDYYGLFKGCYFTNNEAGFPCLAFDNFARKCSQCLSGYTLDPNTSSCLANTTCPARQYFHFGSCFQVDDKCGDFDPFTGDCFTCANLSLTLINKQCIAVAVVCGEREWKDGLTCLKVSEECETFDPSNGHCLTCKNTTFTPTGGSCVELAVICPQGQYRVNLTCVPIPTVCLNFDPPTQTCLKCIVGYFLQGGLCTRLVCPTGQIPSRFGPFCIDLSPLCAQYDPISSLCLSCVNPNHRPNPNGECLQVISPLAGCKERERLGFGKCAEPDNHCKAYNLVTGNCDECQPGFFIDFAGRCQRDALCPAGQWSVNGECLPIAENCLRINAVGLCDRCGDDYRLEGGQCVRNKQCAAGQFLNAGGQCVDVSAQCGVFNPTNGECVTCKSGVIPHLGHCCEEGRIFDGKICQQTSNREQKDSSCVSWHPFLGLCLRCPSGFTPNPLPGRTCIEE